MTHPFTRYVGDDGYGEKNEALVEDDEVKEDKDPEEGGEDGGGGDGGDQERYF